MPLPFIPLILGGAAVATGLFGVGKGVKAVCDNNKAKDINRDAQDIVDTAKENLEKARNSTKRSLEALGEKKLAVCQGSLTDFVREFERIKNVELEESPGLDELGKFKMDKANFAQLREVTILAGSLVGGTAAGTVAGGAMAFGAYGAAGALATASTGTAIAGLSGAAATNATLAFFGGGSLAAGGLGIAGGTMVLGGLVAGPALAVLGVVMGAKASANLDRAYSNLAEARETEEQVKVLVTACKGINERSRIFLKLLITLDGNLTLMLSDLQEILDTEGVDYGMYSQKTRQFIAALVSTVQALKAILDTPLLDDKGALTRESQICADQVGRLLSEA